MKTYKFLLVSASTLFTMSLATYMNNDVLADTRTQSLETFAAINKELHASGIEFDNYLGNPVNSGILKLSKGSTIKLDYNIKYYGQGDISQLELLWGEVPNVTISATNNGDGTGSVYLTANEEINYSHPGVLFRVVGAATPYSQRVMLTTVPSTQNDNIPPVTPEPDNPTVDPTPEEPTVTPEPDNPTVDPTPEEPTVTPEPDEPTVQPLPDEPAVSTDSSANDAILNNLTIIRPVSNQTLANKSSGPQLNNTNTSLLIRSNRSGQELNNAIQLGKNNSLPETGQKDNYFITLLGIMVSTLGSLFLLKKSN